MTDLEYVVKCCHGHAERELFLTSAHNYEKLLARTLALIDLCKKRKPRHVRRDDDLLALLKEFPL